MPTTVYGYICLEDDDEPRVDRLHDHLTAHAAAEGWALAEVFVDRNMPPGRIVRPGLTVLLEVVGRTDGCAVLVASLEHLSSSTPIRQAIEVEITSAGGRILAMDSPEGSALHPAQPAEHRT